MLCLGREDAEFFLPRKDLVARLVSTLVEAALVARCCARIQLGALLHDAREAYLSDLPYPLKHFSEFGRLYRDVERRLQQAITEHFGLSPEPPAALREADRAPLAAERLALMADAWEWPELVRSDHHLDAPISALVGRAVEVGQTLPIPAERREYAITEGWIHLPRAEPLAVFEPSPPVS